MENFADNIKFALNRDVSRRLLIRYFMSQDNNFDRSVYPPSIYDLPNQVPELYDKIEIIPHARCIDPLTDRAELGWNLFVLGTNRMYLGETYHNNIKELALQLQNGQILAEDKVATRQTTPRRIITFITRVLESHRGGYIDLSTHPLPTELQHKLGNTSISSAQQFLRRVGYTGLT